MRFVVQHPIPWKSPVRVVRGFAIVRVLLNNKSAIYKSCQIKESFEFLLLVGMGHRACWRFGWVHSYLMWWWIRVFYPRCEKTHFSVEESSVLSKYLILMTTAGWCSSFQLKIRTVVHVRHCPVQFQSWRSDLNWLKLVAGELVIEDIKVGSKRVPCWCSIKAAFHSSPSLIICWLIPT